MSLQLTTGMMTTAYDYLCETDPFRRYNLPHSEDVVFKVNRSTKFFGYYYFDKNSKHTIEASARKISMTDTLMKLMAHEMIHLHLQIMGWETKSTNPNTHGKAFEKVAARVCQFHGFDYKEFY